MHLLAKEEYGLRCLLQVARHAGQGPVSAAMVAEAEGLSPEYAAKLLGELRRGDLVRSTRGATGGYGLGRPASEITVWEAFVALGRPLFVECFCEWPPRQRRQCVHMADCAIRALWRVSDRAVRELFERVSIADLLRTEQSLALALGLGEEPVRDREGPGEP
jgi:Rrf2 family protein